VLIKVPDRRDRSIGTAFSYVAGFGPGFSVWLMLLYDFFFWLGTVDSGGLKERARAKPPRRDGVEEGKEEVIRLRAADPKDVGEARQRDSKQEVRPHTGEALQKSHP
jgi:hypothetical protein